MADVEILLQGLQENHDHETAILELLAETNVERFLLSVAFARSSGVSRISDALCSISDKVDFYIGIANGVTSIQAIQSLLDLGINPYLIDMGSNRRIYHPKIYAALKSREARIILGSANLTYSGLNENIEASTIIKLSDNVPSDLAYVTTLKSKVQNLHANYPEHVQQVQDTDWLNMLFEEGRLEDENIRRKAPVIGRKSNNIDARTVKAFP